MALRCAIVTSHASTFAPSSSCGYAFSAARNVSDQASSASSGPTTARHTRSTIGPKSATICSKGRKLTLRKRPGRPERETPRQNGEAAHRRLQLQQRPLALQAARVPGQLPVRADHPVARHHDAQPVAGVGHPHLLRQRGVAELAGQLAVAAGLPVRDRRHQGPHLPVERFAVQIEVQLEGGALAGEILAELPHRLGEFRWRAAAQPPGPRPVALAGEIHPGQGAVVADQRQLAQRRVHYRVRHAHQSRCHTR